MVRALCSQVRPFVPPKQNRNTLNKELRDEMPFPKRLSQRSKRSDSETFARYRVIWALQAQSWKKSPKMSSRGRKSRKRSRKESKYLKNNQCWLFFRLRFGVLGPRAGRELTFGFLFQLWAGRA